MGAEWLRLGAEVTWGMRVLRGASCAACPEGTGGGCRPSSDPAMSRAHIIVYKHILSYRCASVNPLCNHLAGRPRSPTPRAPMGGGPRGTMLTVLFLCEWIGN